jgi:UDP-N-acetylglucosamine 2-epimerase (non-hydrolysing)
MIHVLIGTKGQYIKMAPVLRELERRKINYNLIHTSQHFNITKELTDTFQIKKPDIYITKKEGDLKNFPSMLSWFSKTLFYGIKKRKEIWRKQNGIVLLHGDTESTLLGIILAKISKIKIFHIESGLRSYDFFNPFPEELNRVIASHFSEVLFAPSIWAKKNLDKTKKEIICTYNNTVIDALRYITCHKEYINYNPPLYKYVIAAIHRKETTYSKKRLKIVIKTLQLAAKSYRVIFILHKNTAFALKKLNLFSEIERNDNVTLFYDYLNYSKFMKLVTQSEFVITDGGGLQEETYFFNRPCLLLRKKTERIEGLGETACLSKFDFSIIQEFIANHQNYHREKKINKEKPSKIIVDYLVNNYKNYL